MRFSIYNFLFIFATIESLQIINTKLGKLRGITEYSSDGNSKHIFKKIPFAKPPIGKLRFELPQKTEPWKGIKDASKYSAACISDPSASSTIQKKMDEDCLYLNIFTSQRCLESSNCSVIVYYHGGGFNMDSAVMFPDKFILERYVSEDIVFAIPAYRLGVFGLFNIGDENLVADNLALFDSQLALHFIHDNINSFGGDPNKVTLMGHSSGATLVGLFAFSKLIDPNKVLFQKYISFSGSLNLSRRELLEQTSFEIASDVGCSNMTKSEILECMRKINPYKLLKSQSKIEKEKGHIMQGILRGLPIMQKEEKYEIFLQNVTARDALYGTTEYEFGKMPDSNENPALAGAPLDFENPYEVAAHFNDLKRNNSDWFSSDTQEVFVSAAIYSAANTDAGGTTYLYETRQDVSYHISDMQFIIGIHKDDKLTLGQQVLDSVYSKFLVNFTKIGTPNDYWKPLNTSQMNYLVLEYDFSKSILPSMDTNYHEDIVDFWKINMTSYDREISKLKKFATKTPFYPGPVILEPTTELYFSIENTTNVFEGTTISTVLKEGTTFILTQWWFYVLVLLVILIILLGCYYCCRNRSEEQLPLIS